MKKIKEWFNKLRRDLGTWLIPKENVISVWDEGPVSTSELAAVKEWMEKVKKQIEVEEWTESTDKLSEFEFDDKDHIELTTEALPEKKHPDPWLKDYPDAPIRHTTSNGWFRQGVMTMQYFVNTINEHAKFTQYDEQTVEWYHKEYSLTGGPLGIKILENDYQQDYEQRLSKYLDNKITDEVKKQHSLNEILIRAEADVSSASTHYLDNHGLTVRKTNMLRIAERLKIPRLYTGTAKSKDGTYTYFLPDAAKVMIEEFVKVYTTYDPNRDG